MQAVNHFLVHPAELLCQKIRLFLVVSLQVYTVPRTDDSL